MQKNYWICRTDRSHRKFIENKLRGGELRQGWGQRDSQNLRKLTEDGGARRNLRMLHVKAGDLVLLPHVPHYGLVGIAEAVCDWQDGYQYAASSETGDHRHIFPVEYHKSFSLQASAVPGELRTTMHNRGRFWNVNRLGSTIEKLLADESDDALNSIDHATRASYVWDEVFEEQFIGATADVSERIMSKFNSQFQSSAWEYLLVEILQTLFPNYVVERVGGRSEVDHGADITVSMPGIFFDESYVIAIQVKDYNGKANDAAIKQIQKSDAYFDADDGQKLIEKWVIYTNVDKDDHAYDGMPTNTRVFYRRDVRRLLTQASFQAMEARFRESG